MAKRPRLAIVGRPNVGKSALFNRICNKRIAIVDEAEGITRDRLYAHCESFGFVFESIDTGGIDPRSVDQFGAEIRRQAEIAIEEAERIVMVVDGRAGPHLLDYELARFLLKHNKHVTLAVNKIDDMAQESLVHAFHGLGFNRIIGVSAAQAYHIPELIELVWDGFPMPPLEKELPGIKLAVIGRANVGKSTLINTFLDEERCVVSPIAGTTRDSIDIPFKSKGKEYVLIDTAGIRRKHAEKEVVEKFAAIRTKEAIERADVCLLVFDAQEGISTQEKRIAKEIEESGKSCVVLMNKWDLVEGFRMEHCLQALRQEVSFLTHCPILFISAKEGRNVGKILTEVENVFAAAQLRITTHQLNKFVEKAIQLNHPPMMTGKRLRIYYMTQVDIRPPRFVLFVNRPELMADSYKKYLINQFRKHYGFTGTPLEFYLRGKPPGRLAPALSED